MNRNVTVLRHADKDILEIIDWYNFKIEDKSSRFLSELNSFIHIINDHPRSFIVVYKGHRECSMVIFPYNIYYFVENDKAFIIAVIHHARHPNTWKKRIRKR